ncbi:MAG: hypothetical protein ABFE08_02720 [Armatimonadia bacterium]
MNRTRLWIIVAVLAVATVSVVVWQNYGSGRHEASVAREPLAVQPPGDGVVAGPAPTPAPAQAEAEKAGNKPHRPKTAEESLPPLLPGNPLTDPKFTDISAKIVVAAIGLKQGKDYELNLLAYMEKALNEAKITEEQYTAYAEALRKNQDRGRAVAEAIINKVEKKIGYRVTVEKLPMFKMDPEQVKKIEGDVRRQEKAGKKKR